MVGSSLVAGLSDEASGDPTSYCLASFPFPATAELTATAGQRDLVMYLGEAIGRSVDTPGGIGGSGCRWPWVRLGNGHAFWVGCLHVSTSRTSLRTIREKYVFHFCLGDVLDVLTCIFLGSFEDVAARMSLPDGIESFAGGDEAPGVGFQHAGKAPPSFDGVATVGV